MNGYALFARYGMDDVLLRLYDSLLTSRLSAIAEAEKLYAAPQEVAARYRLQSEVFDVDLSVLLNSAVTFCVVRIEDGKPVEQVFQTETHWGNE